jgi:hypothetical protein
MDPNWISATASAVALAGSGVSFFIARKSRLRAEKFEMQSAQIAVIQNQLAHQMWADEFFRDVTTWAGGVSLSISRAIHLIEQANPAELNEVMIELSAAIDTGRWYFPNRHENHHGSEKQPAYRGYRQEILDWIVEAYEIIENPAKFSSPRTKLIDCQRHFVSCVQEVLDPRTREKAIQKVLSDFEGVASLPKIRALKND